MQNIRTFMKGLTVFLLPLLALTSTLSLGAAQLQVAQVANPTGVVGVPYSFTGVVAVNGGTAPYTFSVTSGSLPPGLILSGNTISGTPTASATPFNFTVTVKDSSKPQQSGSAPVTLNVFPSGSVVITTNSLPAGTIGVPYSQTIKASGGVTPYTWSLRGNSTLPAGLRLSGATISGTPTAQVVSANFTVQVVDSSKKSGQNTAQMPLTITVQAPPLKIATTTLPSGTVGSIYSAPLNATGGTTPYTWSIASGSAPGGLTLSSTGLLSGTPTTASVGSPFSVKIQVKDSSTTQQTATATLSLQIAADPLSITAKSLTTGVVGVTYSAQLASSGGTGTVTWKLAKGSSLVAGLLLSSSGAISGSPTAPTSGAASFSVVATDSASTAHTATAQITYTINPAKPTITSLSPNSATAGASGFQMTITGANFTSNAVVKWNSATVVSSYTSPTQLAATVPAGMVANAGSASVTVTTAGGTSTAATFTINPASTAKCTADGSGNARLKGGYALQLSQIRTDDNGWQDFMMGAFTADGKGNFTGIFDTNTPYSSNGDQNGNTTGTYSVGSDNRGELSISIPQGSGASHVIDFCIALDSVSNGIAGSGRMIENYTGMGVGSGAFYAQGGSNFTLSAAQGSWVFGAQGLSNNDGQLGRVAVAGFFTLDGSGKVTTGQTDVSYDSYQDGVLENSFIHQTGMTGTYTLASSGRGTMTITVPSGQGGSGTSHMVFYVAGPNHVLLMNSDPGGGQSKGPVTGGQGFLRTTSTFKNSTLSGTSVFVDNAISDTNSTGWDQRKVEAGILTFDGNGNLTGTSDTNDAGTVVLAPDGFSSSYSVDANGRVTTGGSAGPNFYLVGPNQGYGVKGGLKATLVYMENQTVPSGGFKLSSFGGAYSTGTLWYGFEPQNATSGVGTANGAGSFLGTVDLNNDGNVSVGVAYNEPYTAAASGRFVLMNGSQPWAALYMVSPTKAYTIDISGKQWEPLQVFTHQ